MSKPIKEAINHLYQEVEIPDKELKRLLSLPTKSVRKPLVSYVTSALAVSAMVLGLCFWWGFAGPQIMDKTEAIIADVVDNHLSHKTLKYHTESLSQLGDHFSYLGFMVSTSEPMAGIESTLLGARPCLIVNIPAAQLRYQTSDDLWVTVFQTRYEKSIHGDIPNIAKEPPTIDTVSGVRVSVWQEKGLLFAMAQPN